MALGARPRRASRERAGGPVAPTKREYQLKQIVLDTETTGLNPKLGDRIIEIGCVELLSRRERARLPRVHQPGARGGARRDARAWPHARGPRREAEVRRGRPAFLDYIRGAELIIHNADFDVEFLNMELELARSGGCRTTSPRSPTRLFAKELHPGKKNSLDAL